MGKVVLQNTVVGMGSFYLNTDHASYHFLSVSHIACLLKISTE